jgi:hypothetical protein
MTPISSTQGVASLSPIGLEQALTPDALMTYCKSRLQHLDGAIHEHFSRQQDLRNASSAIGALQQKLTDAATLKEGVKADDAQTRNEITAQFENALAALPESHPRRAEVLQVYAFYKATLVDAMVSPSELNSMAQSIGSVVKDLGSSAELDMISLQSLMTQRQTAIQLCTNLVAALGESTKLIAQRIGA